MLRAIRTSFVYVFFFTLSAFVIGVFSQVAGAQDDNILWSSNTPSVVSAREDANSFNSCFYTHYKAQQVKVVGRNGLRDVCYSSGQHVNVGTYGDGELVSFPGDSQMYPVTNLSCSVHPACLYVPAQDMLIARDSIYGYYATKLTIYRNFTQRLQRSINPTTLNTQYSFDRSDPDFVFKDTEGNVLPVRSMDVSSNGKWLAAEVEGAAIIRINLDTLDIRKFSNFKSQYWYAGPMIEYDISDDGRHVAMMGMNMGPQVYDIDEACGKNITAYDTFTNIAQNTPNICSSIDLGDAALSAITGFRIGYNPKFSNDGGELSIDAVGSSGLKKLTLRAANYTPSPGLDYLALGDSYSSGEGDVERNRSATYYTPVTDYDRGCHLSTRSYPFLLRDKWNISTTKMQSVACSGAQVVFDYNRPLENYLGQTNRLQDQPKETRIKNQQTALEKFIPGKVPQLEFVKKYKPKTITVMGGGNDVGFASMLGYCAYGSPNVDPENPWSIIKEGFYGLFTCDFAKAGSLTQKLTLKAIEDQRMYTTSLLSAIKQASPETKIYLVGYPSFVSPEMLSCVNSLELDIAERMTIDYFLKSLNLQLQKAAQDEDITFVDIEDSLNGGRLCEGSEYVSGPKDVDIIHNGTAELFHPNARGHQQIAKIINEKIMDEADSSLSAVERPSSVGSDIFNGVVRLLQITANDIMSGHPINFSAPDYTFSPSSQVLATLHSDPVDLGNLTVNASGGIDSLLTPHNNLPSGFHFLTLTGKSYSGEDVTVYQFVTVGLDAERTKQQQNFIVDDQIAQLNQSQQDPSKEESNSNEDIESEKDNSRKLSHKVDTSVSARPHGFNQSSWADDFVWLLLGTISVGLFSAVIYRIRKSLT